MTPIEYYIIDVFAQRKYTGNQLAVFLNTAGLSTEQMQLMAQEINFAESTFIDSNNKSNGGYNVRIFTPQVELPFAGHPTIGTAYVINQIIENGDSAEITLNLGVGQIPVNIEYEEGKASTHWMRQVNPKFGNTLPTEATAQMLGIDAADIDDRFPILKVSTGIPFYIAPIRSLEAVKKALPNFNQLVQLLNAHNDELNFDKEGKEVESSIFIFCPEAEDLGNDFHARMFAPAFGVEEDAATGSAQGCFLSYLIQQNYKGSSEVKAIVEQGYEIERFSRIQLNGKCISEAEIEVNVGGQIELISKGEWYV